MEPEGPRQSVHFEIPDLASAVRLTRRLGGRWDVSLRDSRDINLVSVALRPQPSDLAVLLRNVEAWVKEESLYAIRFGVDGREYVLTAGETNWEAFPSAAARAS
jgi:hypothetical protein